MASATEEFAEITSAALQLDSWEGFDVFRVASLTHGRPLETVAVALIRRFELIDKLQLPQDKLCNFLRVSTSSASEYYIRLASLS